MGIGVRLSPKKHWNAPFAALKSKHFLGEDPQTPIQRTISY